MKTPAPSTYASVAVKKEIRAEIIRLCLEIKKHKDLASVFFTAKIPSKQARNIFSFLMALISQGGYIRITKKAIAPRIRTTAINKV